MTSRGFDFAPDFVWGVATSSYQIEGAADTDGKGVGNWDAFSERPAAIHEGHRADLACDHYHRLDEDLDLIADLGVRAYRFSVSWPRVLPLARGTPSDQGLAFYDRLVDGLLARGITPYLTLFHWDAPQEFERLGGFRNPDSSNWFAEYAGIVSRHLGDRVRHYFTLNEPHAFIEGGLRHGRHAPGLTLPLREVLTAAHHALLAHGKSVQVLRAEVSGAWVAMAPVLVSGIPASSTTADVEAARQFTFAALGDGLRTTAFWTDPVMGRGYPTDCLSLFGNKMPIFPAGDLDLIAQPLDAFGVNLYDAPLVRAGADGLPEIVPYPPGFPRTAFDWPVTPDAHYYGVKFCYERYQKPILITENGLSCRDWRQTDGRVRDTERIDFLHRHLSALERAHADAVPIQGYFHWSLLDNFEWNHGYRERFGLVHVDFASGQRTPKDSFHVYRDVIRASTARTASI
jgi:beta-glucosidase